MEHMVSGQKHMINRIYGGSTTSILWPKNIEYVHHQCPPKKYQEMILTGLKEITNPQTMRYYKGYTGKSKKKTYTCIVWSPQLNLSLLTIADQRSQPPSAYAKNLSSARWISRSVCALENGGKSNCSPKRCPKEEKYVRFVGLRASTVLISSLSDL